MWRDKLGVTEMFVSFFDLYAVEKAVDNYRDFLESILSYYEETVIMKSISEMKLMSETKVQQESSCGSLPSPTPLAPLLKLEEPQLLPPSQPTMCPDTPAPLVPKEEEEGEAPLPLYLPPPGAESGAPSQLAGLPGLSLLRPASRQKTTPLGAAGLLQRTEGATPEEAARPPPAPRHLTPASLLSAMAADVGLLTFRSPPLPPPPLLTGGGASVAAAATSFRCSLCPRSFQQRAHLLLHEQAHFRQRLDPNAPGPAADGGGAAPKRGGGAFACAECSKSFSTRFRLRVHRRLHTGETPYVCPFCGKGFVDRGNYAVHQRVHTRERPYHCGVCTKQFSTKGNLSRHQQSQHGPPIQSVRLV